MNFKQSGLEIHPELNIKRYIRSPVRVVINRGQFHHCSVMSDLFSHVCSSLYWVGILGSLCV